MQIIQGLLFLPPSKRKVSYHFIGDFMALCMISLIPQQPCEMDVPSNSLRKKLSLQTAAQSLLGNNSGDKQPRSVCSEAALNCKRRGCSRSAALGDTLPRGIQPFGTSGPHIKYIATQNHKKFVVLSKFVIFCWAALIAILGRMRPTDHRLDTPAKFNLGVSRSGAPVHTAG